MPRAGGCHRGRRPARLFFAGYDWFFTGQYAPENAEHRRVKSEIMVGSGLPDITTTSEVCSALRRAGFELFDAHDRAAEADQETPWHRALQSRDLRLTSIPRTPVGRALTNLTLRVGEGLRLFPKGTRAVSTFLNVGADALEEGSRSGIFTPLFFSLARKPECSRFRHVPGASRPATVRLSEMPD